MLPIRRLPVRPDAAALEEEAEQLLEETRAGDGASSAAFTTGSLAGAQQHLAERYQANDWTRLMQAVSLADAIWRDDIDTVRALVTAHPSLLHEPVLLRADSNWGAPLSYAANLGRDDIIRMLYQLGATDLEHALDRAALQGQVQTVRMLHAWLGAPVPPDDALSGPAYTLNEQGTALLLELGARVLDAEGRRLAPVDVVLETDSRKPAVKHAILELYAARGLELPDTPTMALHRGRIDLLEAHLARDPSVLHRTFTQREIYPAEMGCTDAANATVGTPLDGTTLLHMAVDYDELEIARWLLARGFDVNARSAVGASGFGGYSALFNTVVSQPNFWMNYQSRGPFVAPMTELLLAHGADVNVRASIWKSLHPGHGDPARHDYRDVTPLSWGRRFHAPIFVSAPALQLIADAGGVE